MGDRSSSVEQVILLSKILKMLGSSVERNPIKADFEYDASGNLTKITLTDKVTNKVREITFTYDASGNLISINES